MQDFKPNSHRFKEEQQQAASEEKRVSKVIKGSAKIRENKAKKLADIFISEDVADVKSYVIMDIIVPMLRNAIYDIITGSADMIIYGKNGRSKKSSGGSKVSYRNFYDDPRDRAPRTTNSLTSFNYDEISFESRGDAQLALDQLDDLIERYGFATVADLYDIAQLSSPYTSNKYGWTNVRNGEAVRTRDGYKLKLPKAMPIN